MRRYRYLLSPVLVLACVTVAAAQTLLTDEPVPLKAWEVMVKGIFTVGIMAIGPFITGYIMTWPPLAKYMIASLAGLLAGAAAGQIDGFPLTSESAANMGLALAPAGQAIVNNGWLRRDPPPATPGGA